MRYEDIDDEQLVSMLHESSDDAKDILFDKYNDFNESKWLNDIDSPRYESINDNRNDSNAFEKVNEWE